MNKLLEVNNLAKLYKSYNYQVRALEGICFSAARGDFLSILGPSGAGKSTLLHVLGGILSPDKGEVLYQGRNIYAQRESRLAFWRNKSIGFVFQFYYLIEELNVLENIILAAFGMRKKYSFQRAQGLLEYLRLEKRSRFYPSQLSGGEKQRVAIARALINEPEVVLCDEPTGNLDRDSQENIKSLLKKINREKNTTVIMVTHNMDLAKTAEKIILIEDGKLKK